MASVIETETEPANAPPSGVIAGVVTVVFFELPVVVFVVASVVVLEKAPEVDAVVVVDIAVLVVGAVELVELVSMFDG